MKTITKELAAQVLSIVDHGLCKGIGNPIPGQMCVEAAVCFALGEPHSDNPSCVSQVLRRFKIGLNDARWSSNAARARGLRRIAIAQLGTAGTLDEGMLAAKLSKMVIRKLLPRVLRSVAELKEEPHKTRVINKLLPRVLRSVAELQEEPHKTQLLATATRCKTEGTWEAAAAATEAAAAAAESWTAAAAESWTAAAKTAAADRWTADLVSSAAVAAATAVRWAAEAADAAETATADRWAADAAEAATRWTAATAADQLLSEFAEEVVQILVEMKTPGSYFLFLTH